LETPSGVNFGRTRGVAGTQHHLARVGYLALCSKHLALAETR
jgi:hypothetical protein